MRRVRLDKSCCLKGPIALVYVRNYKMDGTADLAVVCVLRQEDQLVPSSELRKDWKTWLVPILPIDGESKALNIEWKTGRSAGYAKDGYHGLSHDDLSL